MTGPARGGRLTRSDTALAVLWGAVALNVAAVWLLFLTGDSSPEPALSAARFTGSHAGLLMALQVVLVARIPWLDRRLGMGQLTAWHRWTGFGLMWTVVVHASLALLGYARIHHWPLGTLVEKFTGSLGTLAGIGAATALVIIAVSSVRAARRRLSYETWHAVHVVSYLAFALVVVHQSIEGIFSEPSTAARSYWAALWTFAGGAFVLCRIVLPLWRFNRHRLRVAAVVAESADVVSVHVTGRDLDRLPALAGQFFLWRFLTRGRWWQVNPFSLSIAPDGRTLRLTAKAAGAGSAGLRHVPVGTRVMAEGPYGAFTALHRTRPATLLIAGGVGVTPIRSLLEALDGPVTVLYRARTEAGAVLLAELRALAATRGTVVHVVTGRTAGAHPAPLSAEHLTALVPDVRDRDVYVCGPAPMTAAVLRTLRDLGVPRAQRHAEVFALAG